MYSCYVLLANGMKFDFFFFFMKFACWEICMKYSFGFKSHRQIATV